MEVEDGELSSSSDSNPKDKRHKSSRRDKHRRVLAHESDDDAVSISSASTGTMDEDENGVGPEEPAPCIRAIVHQSTAPDLRQGALFIVTCMGGTIGREGSQHAVLIGDANMSKTHASITYEEAPDPDPETGKIRKGKFYFISDCRSKNGTWLNGSRLPAPESDTDYAAKFPIVHGSTLKMGDTTLLLHIHPGDQTCGHCEPGLLLQHEPMYPVEPGVMTTRAEKDAARRKEQRKLRQKFGVAGDASGALSKLPESYKDRAEERRVTKGSDNPFEKTEVASIDEPIRETNKGYNLMKKMGWSDGASLGQSADGGIKEPVSVTNKF
jgi:pSer/pThr/pTyr-binding forkhead associated (FHA) protein